jgi:ABC-type transport system involved in multi-copper enzyme maturation permease subunit
MIEAIRKTSIIQFATMQEAVRQPVFVLLLIGVLVLNAVNAVVPFFTLDADLKMYKDCGLAFILASTLLLVIWTASTSIADEIEGKTAMTLLSKPVNRQQFITGKFLGILTAAVMFMLPLVLAFLVTVFFKVDYDKKEQIYGPELHREYGVQETISDRVREVQLILPGIVLILLEVVVMTAVSVAISTRASMIVNVVSCLAIYVVGHMTSALVYGGALRHETVQFIARMIATVLPALEHFNIQGAIATGQVVPTSYLVYSALYSAAYTMIALLAAFLMFDDRDLA